MPPIKRYSASEIAKMRLPGLPGTKAKVIARATSEAWPFVEAKGVGGTKRLYEVPPQYFDGTSYAAPVAVKVIEAAQGGPVAGVIAAGSARVDPVLLETAIQALAEWEEERHISVAGDRRSAIVAILYDYLQNAAGGGKEAMAVVLRALG